MKKNNKNDYLTELRVKRIKECMGECGLTQKEIAIDLNYTEQHISYVFNGRRALTTEMAINLAHIFSKRDQHKTAQVDIPYSELPESQKIEFCEDDIKENGCVSVFFDFPDEIDYRYLLGEVDYKNSYENFYEPLKKNNNYLFQNGIRALLHKHGYELIADTYIGMDFDALEKSFLNIDSLLHGIICKNTAYKEKNLKLVKTSTGETIFISPLELFQLINDYEKSLIFITDRFFEKVVMQNAIDAPSKDTPEHEKYF